MKETMTAKVKANLLKTVFFVTAILIILSNSAAAQQSFRDLAKEYGVDWLAGRWIAKTDNGTSIQLVYKWELNGHLLSVDFKMGPYASKGMIFFAPGAEKATQVSVDNMGSRSKGEWELDADGNLISKSENVNAEGKVRKGGAIYKKVDAKTITVAIYGLNEDGDLNDEPWITTEFKRQPTKKKDAA